MPPLEPVVRGIILEDVGDRIIIQPSTHDVERFAPQTPVGVRPWSWTMPLPPMPGTQVFDASGRPIGVVRDSQIWADEVDVTTMGSPVRMTAVGRRHFSITVEGLLP